ncbi:MULTISPECIES: hypothetical protein [Gordonia]|jgi:hypothetical protein|uniref:Uncharacterized protein n=1 Tax=Gordonia aquimaris TaxID=2984863 RepID=A0A9X3D979_9ACTN|nr:MULTISPECIES: hypothetical protein [Gordonia]MCX2965962.1 hypothetical protein [Gordonia aquimaris]
MRLSNTSSGPRRHARLSSITGRFGRARSARSFPAEAERLITPAELRRLQA